MRGGYALPSDGTSGQSSLPPSPSPLAALLYFSKIQIQKIWEISSKQVSNPGDSSCPPLQLAPCAGCCRKISCGPSCHRVKKYRLRRNTSLAGAAQPDRKGTRQQGGIDGIYTHATFEHINSPIRPPCSMHALATAHEHKWQGLKCKVPPDFCQETKLCARLGILRVVQQLGAPANFKTLVACTRQHGGLRRARLVQGTRR